LCMSEAALISRSPVLRRERWPLHPLVEPFLMR
jgi:hypothetical protein